MKQFFIVLSVLLFISNVRSIAQPCIPYSGYTTWMGYTDAWEDSANWCPAIAPLSSNPLMNVRIPGGPAGPYTYHRPVIRSGVNALTEKLRIESGDTIYLYGMNQSSLTVNDSLKILNASSAIVVNNPYIDSVQVNNGTINLPDNSPLNNQNRSRSFIIIQQSELLAQGMQPGDVICRLLLHIQRNSNGYPYRNFTVKYYHTTISGVISGTGYSAIIPLPIGAVPTTLWYGDLYPPAYIPGLNGYGTIALDLQVPIVWSGSSNSICLEMCYDNTGFPSTGINDEPRFTQTGILNRYLSIQALTSYNQAGCNIMPSDTVIVNATWTAGTNIVTLNIPSQAASVLPGMICYPGGQTVVSVAGTTLTLDSLLTTSGTNTNLTLSNVRVVASNFRPNVTFVTGCDSIYKYPINVRGHWENNGTFTAGISRVTFDGTIADQQIAGQSPTTFYDLDISNANHVLRYSDFTVKDSLRLLNGRLKLNLGMMTLLNPDPSAITWTNGRIQSETDLLSANVFPFGRLYWKMGFTTGMRVIPFINSAGVNLFMNYNIDSGIHDVILGTYGTLPDNTNLPLPEVTNVIGFSNGSFNSSGDNAVDRFFLIKDSLGTNPNATITLRYSNSERAFTGIALMGAQRWINALDIWENPLLPNQIYLVGNPDLVIFTLSDTVFNTSDWWTVSNFSAPLGTGIQETDLETIVAFPNPAAPGDMLQLAWNGNRSKPDLICIYNIEGREVFHNKSEHGITTIQIPLGLMPGVYTVHIIEKEQSGMVKLVIMDR